MEKRIRYRDLSQLNKLFCQYYNVGEYEVETKPDSYDKETRSIVVLYKPKEAYVVNSFKGVSL